MIDPVSFQGLRLCEGFMIVQLEFAQESLLDAVGRKAVAETRIIGRKFYLTVLSGLSDKEFSVTLYHEVLEAMTVACADAPDSVQEFNEGDFERAGYQAHEQFGPVSPESLNRMLQFYDFRGE
jgi:hypothetical protein